MWEAVILCVLWLVASIDCQNHETSLYEQLLYTGYNRNARPVRDTNDAVDVQMQLNLHSIEDIDEVGQAMGTLATFSLEWQDEFLTWNPAQYNGLEHIVVPASEIWLPDLGIQNSADTFYQETFSRDFRVDVKYTGRVLWDFGGNFATTCSLDMTYYPFDLQECDVIVENWAYSIDQVNIISTTPTIQEAEYSANGQWDLDATSANTSTYAKPSSPGKVFPKVTFTLYLTRKFTYYFYNVVTPCLFCVFISIMVFWLPPESGEKVSLGITVLLAFSVFQLVVADNTPRNSDYTPMLTMMMTAVMGMTTVSVIISILVLYCYHHTTTTRPPSWLRTAAFKGLARLLFITEHMPPADNQIDAADDPIVVKEDGQGDDTHPNPKLVDDASNLEPVDKDKMSEIVHLLRYIVEDMKQGKKDEAVREEWRALAMVIDRGFFWVTVIVAIVILPYYLARRDTLTT